MSPEVLERSIAKTRQWINDCRRDRQGDLGSRLTQVRSHQTLDLDIDHGRKAVVALVDQRAYVRATGRNDTRRNVHGLLRDKQQS